MEDKEKIKSQISQNQEENDGDSDSNAVNLTIVDPNGEEVHFKVKRTAKMRRLFAAYCKRVGVDPDGMRFFYQGERINEESTPEELVLKDGSKIDAFVRQVAG